MPAQTADQTQVIATAIRDVTQIATLPEITLKIVELVENPSSTAQDLHKVISNDPALCSRILKVVNSSFYGMPGQIGSINRAIVLLGLNAVKNIAISASLAKLFKGGQLCPAFSARDLWKHSVATATAAKLIADAGKLGLPDEAFLAGLIHDMGLMVEMQHDRAKLIDAVNRLEVTKEGAPQKDMLAIEREIFGATHQEFGKALAEKWKFPKGLQIVCGHHHDPRSLPDGQRTLVTVVAIADRLVAQVAEGFRLDIMNAAIDASWLDELKTPPQKVEEIKQALPEKIKEVEVLLTGS